MGSLLAWLMQFSSTSSTTLVLLNTGRGWSLLPQGIILTLLGLFWLATKRPVHVFIEQFYPSNLAVRVTDTFYAQNVLSIKFTLPVLLCPVHYMFWSLGFWQIATKVSCQVCLLSFTKCTLILYCFLKQFNIKEIKADADFL